MRAKGEMTVWFIVRLKQYNILFFLDEQEQKHLCFYKLAKYEEKKNTKKGRNNFCRNLW